MNIERKNILIGISVSTLNGILIPSFYFFLKKHDFSGGICLFTAGAVLAGMLGISFDLIKSKRFGFDRPSIFRGLLLGISQLLFCLSLEKTTVSSAILASTVGSIVGLVGGRYFLHEYLSRFKFLGASIAVAGGFLASDQGLLEPIAVLSGIATGSSAILTRHLMIQANDKLRTVSYTVLFAGIFCFLSMLFMDQKIIHIFFPIQTICIIAGLLFLSQFLSCITLDFLNSQTASVFSLTRIPVSRIIEFIFSGNFGHATGLISMFLVFVGSVMFFVKLPSKHKKASASFS